MNRQSTAGKAQTAPGTYMQTPIFLNWPFVGTEQRAIDAKPSLSSGNVIPHHPGPEEDLWLGTVKSPWQFQNLRHMKSSAMPSNAGAAMYNLMSHCEVY